METTLREPLEPGTAGLLQTLDRIREAISEGARDLAVRREAELMVRHAPAHLSRPQIEAVFEGVLAIDQPQYRYDPIDVELVRGAAAGARAWGVDCDDFVVRAGSLLRSLGFEVEAVVSGSRAPVAGEDPQFQHIYLRVRDRDSGEWIDFDPVLRHPLRRAQLGEAPRAAVRMRVPMTPGYVDLGQVSVGALALQLPAAGLVALDPPAPSALSLTPVPQTWRNVDLDQTLVFDLPVAQIVVPPRDPEITILPLMPVEPEPLESVETKDDRRVEQETTAKTIPNQDSLPVMHIERDEAVPPAPASDRPKGSAIKVAAAVGGGLLVVGLGIVVIRGLQKKKRRK